MSDVRMRYPLHPVFVHFPIAFWMAATVLDVIQWSALLPPIPVIDGFALSHLLLWAGLVAALPTVTAGLLDYARLPSSVQDSRPLLLHILCMGAAFVLFLGAAIWRVKSGDFANEPNGIVIVLESIAAIGLILGGHLASRVVFEVIPRESQRNLTPSSR